MHVAGPEAGAVRHDRDHESFRRHHHGPRRRDLRRSGRRGVGEYQPRQGLDVRADPRFRAEVRGQRRRQPDRIHRRRRADARVPRPERREPRDRRRGAERTAERADQRRRGRNSAHRRGREHRRDDGGRLARTGSARLDLGEAMMTTSHDQPREKLKAYLDQDPRLRSLTTYTKRRFGAEKKLTAHNWEHIYRDTINAIIIGESEGADMRVVLPAIVMHDIGYLYGPPEGHGPRGADKLPEYLDAAGIFYPPDDIA